MIGFAAATDVLVPLVPSETIVITASVLAAQGELLIWVIVPVVALGAFVGDNLCYWLGRKIGDPIADAQPPIPCRRRGKDILGDELPKELAT